MAYGVYECKWYDISAKDAKNLMFIVYRSTVPLRLTAGKFGAFSLEMFGTVRYLGRKTFYFPHNKILFLAYREKERKRNK